MILRSVLKGAIAAAILLIFYFSVLTLISGWNPALAQFYQYWYWILSLSFGFGLQIALFTYLRALKKSVSGKIAAVSGATSGLAMIACCSHYLVNIIPIIGIAGLTTIIGQYQKEFFIIGIIFNLIGIGYLVNKLINFQKNRI